MAWGTNGQIVVGALSNGATYEEPAEGGREQEGKCQGNGGSYLYDQKKVGVGGATLYT